MQYVRRKLADTHCNRILKGDHAEIISEADYLKA